MTTLTNIPKKTISDIDFVSDNGDTYSIGSSEDLTLVAETGFNMTSKQTASLKRIDLPNIARWDDETATWDDPLFSWGGITMTPLTNVQKV